MFGNNWLSNVSKSDILPPLTARMAVKQSTAWKKAILDSFERIGIEQFHENLSFYDYYRMVDGKMSYQELSEVVPHLENLQDLLDGVGVPTFLKHYDILGIIINNLVGKYIDMQSKYHVVDTGEVAENEFLRHKNEEIQKAIQAIIDNEVKMHLAQNGLTPEGKQFSSQEEQQQFMAQLEQAKEEFTPKDSSRSTKSTYKTVGVVWGEATLEKDREMFNLSQLEKSEFKDKLLSGRCFREYKIGRDNYYPRTWSPKNTFFSKEIDSSLVQDGSYVGRVHLYTPSEIIDIYGHELNATQQKELMGGNPAWKNFVGDGVLSGTIEQAIDSNFSKPVRTPFANYFDYNFMLGLQDYTGLPMGEQTLFNPDGTQTVGDRFLPKYSNQLQPGYKNYANILRDDFEHRDDLCLVTEVYFKALDLFGYLSYENELGRVVTEEVTEDILKDFLKENNIKSTYKESIRDMVENFEVNQLVWTYRPVVYEALKVQSGNLKEPIYLYCRPCEHQIKGDSEFDVKLPVAGFIGKSVASKIEPFQAKYNLCMNQIYSLLEKEIGMFFLMDINLIPSEFEGWGDAEEALMSLRSIAKSTGMLPVATSGDSQKNNNNFNQFSTYDISYTNQINNRVALAEFCQRKAYEVIGINPTIMTQPTKYETAEGVRMNNEAGFAQVSEIYEDFNIYNKGALELHLSVAQYCQSNKKDLSLYYTKSDASIEFLKISDPEFPFRRIGLIPSADSRKRKELEKFKEYLFNTNTLGSDTLEVAKLIGSDAMSEVMEIARLERENREKAQQLQHQRDQELIQQKSEFDKQLEQEKWTRLEESKDKDREVDINVATINALGRASDKQSDAKGFEQINKESDRALKEFSLTKKAESDANNLKLREREADESRSLRMEELKLKAKELEEKINKRRSDEYIATINKN